MTRTEALERAKELIGGERQSQYGPPSENFARIAAMWSAYLSAPICSADVANMMVLLKVARNAHGASDDTWVDIAGYAALGAELSS